MLFHIRVLQAALKVGGIRLGSFTLLDRKPRTMSIKDKACLLDLADAVSAIITARYREASNLSRQKMLSVLNMAHHVRTPLMSAALVGSSLQQYSKRLKAVKTMPTEGKVIADKIQDSLVGLQNAYTSIEAVINKVVFEANTLHKDECEHLFAEADEQLDIGRLLLTTCASPLQGIEEGSMRSSLASIKSLSTSKRAMSSQMLTAESVKAASSNFTPSSHKPVRVLVVEDSVIIQKGMKRFLESAGCVVHTAINGKLGLEQLITVVFDAVFVDFLMVCTLQYPFTHESYCSAYTCSP